MAGTGGGPAISGSVEPAHAYMAQAGGGRQWLSAGHNRHFIFARLPDAHDPPQTAAGPAGQGWPG